MSVKTNEVEKACKCFYKLLSEQLEKANGGNSDKEER